jgi:hypothetical protein
MKLISWGFKVALLGLATGCVPQVQNFEQQAIGVANQVVSIYILLVIVFIFVFILGTAFVFRNNPRFRRFWVPSVNRINRVLGRSPIYYVPADMEHVKDEYQLVHDSLGLMRDVESSLKRNPTLSAQSKRSIQAQIEHIPPNLITSVKQLEHLRRIAKTADKYQRDEIDQMDFKLQVQIQHSLQMLKSIPIELMKIELASTDRTVKRLVNDLTETNDKLRDLGASSIELNKIRSRLER